MFVSNSHGSLRKQDAISRKAVCTWVTLSWDDYIFTQSAKSQGNALERGLSVGCGLQGQLSPRLSLTSSMRGVSL